MCLNMVFCSAYLMFPLYSTGLFNIQICHLVMGGIALLLSRVTMTLIYGEPRKLNCWEPCGTKVPLHILSLCRAAFNPCLNCVFCLMLTPYTIPRHVWLLKSGKELLLLIDGWHASIIQVSFLTVCVEKHIVPATCVMTTMFQWHVFILTLLTTVC